MAPTCDRPVAMSILPGMTISQAAPRFSPRRRDRRTMTDITRRGAIGALGSAAAWLAASAARAQAFPSKPMRLLVPFPAGGIVDIVSRAMAEPMQADLGQPVVVEPKPGASGSLAAAMIPQAPADGYNWVMATIGHVV